MNECWHNILLWYQVSLSLMAIGNNDCSVHLWLWFNALLIGHLAIHTINYAACNTILKTQWWKTTLFPGQTLIPNSECYQNFKFTWKKVQIRHLSASNYLLCQMHWRCWQKICMNESWHKILFWHQVLLSSYYGYWQHWLFCPFLIKSLV